MKLTFLSVYRILTDIVRACRAGISVTDQFDLTTCSKAAYCCGERLLFYINPKQVPHFFKISYQSRQRRRLMGNMNSIEKNN